MTARIDRQCTNIDCDIAVIDLDPALSVISRAVNAAGATHKIGSCEDVTIRIDRNGPYVEGKQTVVNLLPALTAIARSKHTDPVGPGKNVIARIDRDCPDLGRYQAIIFLAPSVTIIARAENAAAEICSGKDISTRIRGEGKDKASC